LSQLSTRRNEYAHIRAGQCDHEIEKLRLQEQMQNKQGEELRKLELLQER